MPNVIDAEPPHLHTIIEQKLQQTKEAFDSIVAGVSWEGIVGDWGGTWAALDGLCEAQEGKAAEEGDAGVLDLEGRREVRVGPPYQCIQFCWISLYMEMC